MTRFERSGMSFLIDDQSQRSAVILHAPHSGTTIPAWHRDAFALTHPELDEEHQRMVDSGTLELTRAITRASTIVSDLSRLVVDVERFPDDREEMLQVGMGAYYTHGSQRQPIRTVTPRDRDRLAWFYDSYAEEFSGLVERALTTHGYAVILDIHSYPAAALPYELHGDQPRPELDLGVDDFHTPRELIERARAAFEGIHVMTNSPFAGTYVPLRFYGSEPQVHSLMLELRRDTLQADPARYTAGLQRLVDACVGSPLVVTQSQHVATNGGPKNDG